MIDVSLCSSYIQKKVLVIGAGASGLAAARQLRNFGMQVSYTSVSVCVCVCTVCWNGWVNSALVIGR